jgi:hypothetical protein
MTASTTNQHPARRSAKENTVENQETLMSVAFSREALRASKSLIIL